MREVMAGILTSKLSADSVIKILKGANLIFDDCVMEQTARNVKIPVNQPKKAIKILHENSLEATLITHTFASKH